MEVERRLCIRPLVRLTTILNPSEFLLLLLLFLDLFAVRFSFIIHTSKQVILKKKNTIKKTSP